MASSITLQVKEVLDDYSKEVRRAMTDAEDKIAKEAVQKLKNTSPKRSGKNHIRKYAEGWAIKRTKTSTGIPDVTLYNKTNGPLTHLLEDGHVIRNAYGEYGRFNGIKHIEPVEEWANDALVDKVEKELEK